MLRPIPGFDGQYSVTADGGVYSHPKVAPRGSTGRVHGGMWMKIQTNYKGYLVLSLCKNGKYSQRLVHRLVALTWLSNPDGLPQINHINGLKTDNRAENLEWCTCKQNIAHAFASGLINTRTPAKLAAARRNAVKARAVANGAGV